MKDRLIIFAREPNEGRVKTRLREYISPAMRLELYKAFLKDTLELARAAACIDKVLAYDSTAAGPGYLRRIADDFKFYRQRGRDLGERLHNAFKFGKQKQGDKIVIIGSDSPNLPKEYILEAFRRLDSVDLVLGPSQDGGYYLVGLKSPCKGIFERVKWSSRTALKNTVANARKLGKRVAMLREWYDIDDYAGLSLLKIDLMKNKKAAPWTRRLLDI